MIFHLSSRIGLHAVNTYSPLFNHYLKCSVLASQKAVCSNWSAGTPFFSLVNHLDCMSRFYPEAYRFTVNTSLATVTMALILTYQYESDIKSLGEPEPPL